MIYGLMLTLRIRKLSECYANPGAAGAAAQISDGPTGRTVWGTVAALRNE